MVVALSIIGGLVVAGVMAYGVMQLVQDVKIDSEPDSDSGDET